MIKIKRALFSCWDKTGLAELAGKLLQYDVEIISSGGTASYFKENKISVTSVEDLTGFPEVLGGRVKTLHPLIHSAILATPTSAHLADLEKIDTEPIQLVVVNLYPFVEEAVKNLLPLEKAIEYIDIGGPTLLRGAAKNCHHVLGLFDPQQYDEFLQILDSQNGQIPEDYSVQKAGEIFFYSSWYDAQIQSYFADKSTRENLLPKFHSIHLKKKHDLRYGENPQQKASVFQAYQNKTNGLASLDQLWGKPLSFNNYSDINAAYTLVLEFAKTSVVIIKHANPCGAAASNKGLAEAFQKALRGDPVSAFGGIVACNRAVDFETAKLISKIFFECIIAPGFDADALDILKKKKNLRLLKLDPLKIEAKGLELKSFSDTYLIQEQDQFTEDTSRWEVATKCQPTKADWKEAEFAWKLVKHIKSNAIVLTKDMEIYGVGAGQMSRVDAVKIAKMKALQSQRALNGLILASDAFFPFRDGIDEAVKAGAKLIIQPGGSIRDEDVIKAADEHQISLVLTRTRHFKH